MIKNKSFLLTIASVFALVFLMSVASAAQIFSSTDGSVTGWTITPADSWVDATDYFESNNVADAVLERTISTSGYETIVVKYDRQLIDTSTTSTFETSDEFNVSWYNGSAWTVLEETLDTTPDDANFVSKSFTLPSGANNNANFKLKFTCATGSSTEFCRVDNISIEGTAVASSTDFCAYDGGVTTNDGELRVDIRDITINEGYGKDDEWMPLDEVEIEIRVENNGDYDIDDISLEWGVAESDLENWVIEMDEIDEFNLKDGDEDTFIVTFTLKEKDLEMDFDEIVGNDYKLVVRATGTIDDSDSSHDGDQTCHSDSADVSIIDETDFIILNNVNFVETIQCGMEVQITADVWNVGSDEQEDVLVLIRNTELGIDKRITFSSIDEFDSEKLDVLVQIPSDADEKIYYLEFMVFDEDGDIYENNFDDEESKFSTALKVEGNCGASSTALVSASLISGGKAGEDLTIKTTITNVGSSSATYTVNAAGYTSWASLTSINPSTIVVNSGESKEVLLKFNVNSDSKGEQTFNIEVLSGTSLVASQPVQVTVESSGAGFDLGGSWYLWLIGALNVILVIVIIVIAVRVAKS